ncbi:MAG: ECF-type sigma factor [Acidobacteriota bacterium]
MDRSSPTGIRRAVDRRPEQDEKPDPSVTDWLQRWNRGDEAAQHVVFASVYEDLRRIAGSFFRRERLDHTLQPTALVHEAVLRLFGNAEIEWKDSSQFLGFAARIMRQVLVDYSRERNALKRGGDLQRVELPEALRSRALDTAQILALDEALHALERLDPFQVQVVEARFFVGLSGAECAALLGVSERTVKRQWRRARAWLHAELSQTADADGA